MQPFRRLSALLILCAIGVFSCQKKTETGADDAGLLDFSSDSEKAVQLISDANDELRRIKILYAENETKIDELKAALSKKDIEKVKEISNTLVFVLNDGFAFAATAREKIGQAQELNIDPTFKDYLSLKEQSIEKQIEAFKHRHEAARLLRDSFGASEKPEIEKAKETFKAKEELFQKTMSEAREISKRGDELAKEALKNGN